MASKRPAPGVHPSRAEQVPQEPPRKKTKRPAPPDHGGTKSFKKAHPVHEIKTTIRNLRRLLQNPQNLPPKLRITKERALASAEHELKEAQSADQRSKIIARWHKIRFFDRQKATKRLKRARKALREEDGGDEDAVGRKERLGKEVDECEVDLNYALFYPLERDYVALFPTKRKGQDAEDGEGGKEQQRQGDAKMREVVRKCMREETLEKLRSGKLDDQGNVKKREEQNDEVSTVKTKTEKDSKKRKAAEIEAAASDGESDGGFFE